MSQPTFDFNATTEAAKKAELWRLFQHFAWQVVGSGRKHFSARAIFHRIRWEATVVQRSLTDFKINNNLSKEFSERFMAENPQHQGFFRTRDK